MTFLLSLYVQNLKGKDAFVYQLLSEAKFEVNYQPSMSVLMDVEMMIMETMIFVTLILI